MFIPLNVIKAFKKPSYVKPVVPTLPEIKPIEKREYCPIGYNRDRITTLVSKPTRGNKGTFITAYYKNTSPEFEEKQRLAKFDIFKNWE